VFMLVYCSEVKLRRKGLQHDEPDRCVQVPMVAKAQDSTPMTRVFEMRRRDSRQARRRGMTAFMLMAASACGMMSRPDWMG
jgi:hypothetical protein